MTKLIAAIMAGMFSVAVASAYAGEMKGDAKKSEMAKEKSKSDDAKKKDKKDEKK